MPARELIRGRPVMPAVRTTFAVVAFLSFAVSGHTADTYPTKTIRILTAGAAGGPIDIMARIVGQKLTDQLGQPVVIDNRGGAGGTLATRIAVSGTPDGHTL